MIVGYRRVATHVLAVLALCAYVAAVLLNCQITSRCRRVSLIYLSSVRF